MTGAQATTDLVDGSRNNWLIWISILAAAVGLIDSLYLTWIKVGHSTALFCEPGGGCDVVNSSPYSEFMGIPIAILGAGMYLVLLGILGLELRSPFWVANGPLAVFGISLAGVLYSAYLTYLEVAVIHAICPYCVISAIALVVIFGATVIRLVKYQPFQEENLPTRGG